MTKEQMRQAIEDGWNRRGNAGLASDNYSCGFSDGVGWLLCELIRVHVGKLCEGISDLYKELDLYQQDRIVDLKE